MGSPSRQESITEASLRGPGLVLLQASVCVRRVGGKRGRRGQGRGQMDWGRRERGKCGWMRGRLGRVTAELQAP